MRFANLAGFSLVSFLSSRDSSKAPPIKGFVKLWVEEPEEWVSIARSQARSLIFLADSSGIGERTQPPSKDFGSAGSLSANFRLSSCNLLQPLGERREVSNPFQQCQLGVSSPRSVAGVEFIFRVVIKHCLL